MHALSSGFEYRHAEQVFSVETIDAPVVALGERNPIASQRQPNSVQASTPASSTMPGARTTSCGTAKIAASATPPRLKSTEAGVPIHFTVHREMVGNLNTPCEPGSRVLALRGLGNHETPASDQRASAPPQVAQCRVRSG